MLKKRKHHNTEDREDSRKSKTSKRKVSTFAKVSMSIMVILSLVLFYLIVLASYSPKSLPYITNKIEQRLKEKLGEDAVIKNSYVNFTRYFTLKVTVEELKFFYSENSEGKKQEFTLPKIESEFSLFSLLSFRFQPSKVKVINPKIIIAKTVEDSQGSENDLSLILNLIKEEKLPLADFEIENAKIILKGKPDQEIIIKNSKIITHAGIDALYLKSTGVISFENNKNDTKISLNCKLFDELDLKCDFSLENFALNSIANFHQSFAGLKNFNALVNSSGAISVVDHKLDSANFKLESFQGDFELKEFFADKIEFSNFSLKGEYDGKSDLLNLSEIKTDLLPSFSANLKSRLLMTLSISNFQDQESDKKLDFYIKLQNIRGDDIAKYWPVTLAHNGVRDWVTSHINHGLISDAYVKFSLNKNATETILEDVNSKINFSNLDLNYSESFPAIKSLSGVANFTKSGMRIVISSGEVLRSKIHDALVVIPDFDAKNVMLMIRGKSEGHAADSLNHASTSVNFDKYFNGNSDNIFDIRIPLNKTVSLKETYISINSSITKSDTKYFKGDFDVSIKKDFHSNSFMVHADLEKTNLLIKAFGVSKESNVDSGLDFILSVVDNYKKIAITNISLWKQENLAKGKHKSKISGNFVFAIDPFQLVDIDLKNLGFGKNNFQISYKTNNKASVEKISIMGDSLNIGEIIEEKFSSNLGGKGYKNFQLQVAAKRIYLLKDKFFKEVYLSLSCTSGICNNLLARASYGKDRHLLFNTKVKNNNSEISGSIMDVGYIAEAFGISNLVSGGNAEIKLYNEIKENKPVISGKIEIDDGITIFDNSTVKKLSKNTLFSQIKDKIFSNDKTTFDNVKIEFNFTGSLLNIESLIANNYKVGITSKGFINLKDGSQNLKGMIVPGFIINNLFGIGKIPLIGGVISGLLTGGEGGGLFGIRYEYVKKAGDAEASFETYKVSAFVPTTIKNLFDSI